MTDMNKHTIAFIYDNAVVVPTKAKKNDTADFSIVASFISEFMNLGFMPSQDLYKHLLKLDTTQLKTLYNEYVPIMKQSVGAHVDHKPMYPNFPRQVMEASDAELFLNAIIHYMSFGEWKPNYEKLPREVVFEDTKFKTIGKIENAEFRQIFTRLVGTNESLSDQDKKAIEWFMRNYKDLPYPETIPFKENMCLVAGMVFEIKDEEKEIQKAINGLVSTAVDVLRIAAYMSDGDISLAEPTKFKKFNRKERRILTKALANVTSVEDLARHSNKFVRLFHQLHVGDFSKDLWKKAKYVRDNREKIQTFNGMIENYLDKGEVHDAARKLKNRPGEFARRLDHLLRLSKTQKTQHNVYSYFNEVMDQLDTRTIVQLIGHFKNRDQKIKSRTVFPKGNVQKGIMLKNTIEPLNRNLVSLVYNDLMDELEVRGYSGGDWGKIFIDPDMMDCPVPTQMRSASDSADQVARGTHLPIVGDKNTLRFFIYWIGRDIDLSATFHGENFKAMGHVSYTNLRENFACHSGDITSARNGASEFIDIDMDKALKKGYRYVAMNVFVFSGEMFSEHEEVFAGWMTRKHPDSNEIYEPKTVERKVDLVSESRNAVPMVFDLKERKAIWVDLNTSMRSHMFGNNVHSNKASIEETLEAIANMENKMTLYELFYAQATLNGEFTTSREDADVVFGWDGDVTPFDVDKINSEYLK